MDFCQRMFEKCFAVILGNFRSPLQLFKGGTGITIPLSKVDLEVFRAFDADKMTFQTSAKELVGSA
jgi:hypothetical protein